MTDVAIVGAGISGMACALRLQAAGISTITFEAHGQPGGCAGFFRRRGFAFDVGATTLVDFEAGGVGGEFLEQVGLHPLDAELLPGYVAWLPDRQVTLHRDTQAWAAERLRAFGGQAAYHQLWALLDELAKVFWEASRRGIKLPITNLAEAGRAAQRIGLSHLPLTRFLFSTMGDALRKFGLHDDKALVGLLGMLIEDTVHSSVENAPLINAALGITIRGAGLSRHQGGMYGFWKTLRARYEQLGGVLRVGCRVERIEQQAGGFKLHTQRGTFEAGQVISAVPAPVTAKIAPPAVSKGLQPYLERDESAQGGAIVMFLGVPESEIENAGHEFTHHQLLQTYDTPLGNGNNMFISVSSPDDLQSAPAGQRAVMISTHCDLGEWQGLSAEEYANAKCEIGERLLGYARRVYPSLGQQAVVYEIGTPRTYEKFTGRPNGAVGGVRQTLQNSNQHALPYATAIPGFWMVGDSTWPGLGTVACVLGSRHVAHEVTRRVQHSSFYTVTNRRARWLQPLK